MPKREQSPEEEATSLGTEDGSWQRGEEAPGERHEQQPTEGSD